MFYNKIVLHSNNCCNCIVFKKRITTNYKETKDATSGKFGWKFEANNLGVCINQLLASLNLQVLDLHFNSYRRETAPWIRKWENKNSNEILVATRFFSKGFSREKRGKKKNKLRTPTPFSVYSLFLNTLHLAILAQQMGFSPHETS